jgi:hypothetical protein
MAIETINGVAHAKQILKDAGVLMPFDKGYQAHIEAKAKAAKAAEAKESKESKK